MSGKDAKKNPEIQGLYCIYDQQKLFEFVWSIRCQPVNMGVDNCQEGQRAQQNMHLKGIFYWFAILIRLGQSLRHDNTNTGLHACLLRQIYVQEGVSAKRVYYIYSQTICLCSNGIMQNVKVYIVLILLQN